MNTHTHGAYSAPILLPILLGWAAATASTLALLPSVERLQTAVDVTQMLWLSAAISPLAHAGKALALALVAWALIVLQGREPDLRTLISALLFGELLLALDGLLMAGWMQAVPAEAWLDEGRLAAPLTLGHYLAPAANRWMALLGGLSLLHIAWAGLVTGMLSRTTQLGTRLLTSTVGTLFVIRWLTAAAPRLLELS